MPSLPNDQASLSVKAPMPFAVYMIGFLVLMAVVVWAAVIVGVPQLYIGLGILVLLAVGVAVAVGKSRHRDPPPRR